MTEQDRFVPGVPNWVDLATPEPEGVHAFYEGLFGWTFEDAGPAPGGGRYELAQVAGGAVGAVRPATDGAAGWNSYVLVDSAEDLAHRVRDAGGRVLSGPEDLGDLARVLAFADPEGAVLRGWEPRSRRGADVVNTHGSVNFNVLSTRDPEAAIAFYRAVFGWYRLDLGGGTAMWALTAYGDHLERRTPGIREQYAGMGGPAGFENVVASLAPPEDPTSPAGWSVTFAVDDADACAAAAAELGGQVLAGPFDAPWVRMAVLRDPQGAVLTASQFVPPDE